MAMTDQGLIELKPQKGLISLDVKGTGVTQGGVDDLRKALPKLETIR
jgi:hypothetical protein